MVHLPFSKYSGCGNDFILIDNRARIFPSHSRETLQKACHRQLGIGADGLILLEESACANFKLRIFNSDGSEAEMCGNGIRCLAQFAAELGFPAACRIETLAGVLESKISPAGISIRMPQPTDCNWKRTLSLKQGLVVFDSVNTGVPHALLFVDDLEKVPVMQEGLEIRHHPRFGAAGTNVNWVQKKSANTIAIRTFERGVEGETLACGTGATAAALAAAMRYQLQSPITVCTRLGEKLIIDFTILYDSFKNIWMTGPVIKTYHGFFTMT